MTISEKEVCERCFKVADLVGKTGAGRWICEECAMQLEALRLKRVDCLRGVADKKGGRDDDSTAGASRRGWRD